MHWDMGRAGSTNLRIHEFCQSTNELRGCVELRSETFFVDILADGVPEGRFEALLWSSWSASVSAKLGQGGGVTSSFSAAASLEAMVD
jgi:hypothetical protein